MKYILKITIDSNKADSSIPKPNAVLIISFMFAYDGLCLYTNVYRCVIMRGHNHLLQYFFIMQYVFIFIK